MADATRTLDSTIGIVADDAEPSADVSRIRSMVDAHFDFVWRVLRRLGVPESDADDGVQRCFVVAARRIADVGVAQERAFLFQTALRVALAAKRRARRQREDGAEQLSVAIDPAPSPDALIERRWARQRLDDILGTMPTELRAAFVLFELEGFTLIETAGALGVPQGTAASRVRRARKHYEEQVRRLKARLDRGGRP